MVTEAHSIRVPPILSDILEAVAGAVYKDAGDCVETVQQVFKPFFESAVRNPLPADEILSDSYPTATTR
jgi:dsRNA-specific ribonuclease